MYNELHCLSESLTHLESETEQLQVLQQINLETRNAIESLAKDSNGVSWFDRMHNEFIHDIIAYLNKKSADYHLILKATERLVGKDRRVGIMWVPYSKMNYHNISKATTREVTDKSLLAYLGLDRNIRSVAKDTYEMFVSKKQLDESYPSRFVIDTEHCLKQIHDEFEKEMRGGKK